MEQDTGERTSNQDLIKRVRQLCTDNASYSIVPEQPTYPLIWPWTFNFSNATAAGERDNGACIDLITTRTWQPAQYPDDFQLWLKQIERMRTRWYRDNPY